MAAKKKSRRPLFRSSPHRCGEHGHAQGGGEESRFSAKPPSLPPTAICCLEVSTGEASMLQIQSARCNSPALVTHRASTEQRSCDLLNAAKVNRLELCYGSCPIVHTMPSFARDDSLQHRLHFALNQYPVRDPRSPCCRAHCRIPIAEASCCLSEFRFPCAWGVSCLWGKKSGKPWLGLCSQRGEMNYEYEYEYCRPARLPKEKPKGLFVFFFLLFFFAPHSPFHSFRLILSFLLSPSTLPPQLTPHPDTHNY